MPRGIVNRGPFTTDQVIPAGFSTVDIILSSDFTGTINGVAYSGAAGAAQCYDGRPDQLDTIRVVRTTGSFQYAAVAG